MWESSGFTIGETKIPVPALELGVLPDDADADCLDGGRACELNDVLNETSPNTTLAILREDRQTVEVSEFCAWLLVSNASNWLAAFFADEVFLAPSKIGLDPDVRAQRWMLWAVIGIKAELESDIPV